MIYCSAFEVRIGDMNDERRAHTLLDRCRHDSIVVDSDHVDLARDVEEDDMLLL